MPLKSFTQVRYDMMLVNYSNITHLLSMLTNNTTNIQTVSSESRYGRLQRAREYARQQGWEPMKPEEKDEFMKVVAEFTNL